MSLDVYLTMSVDTGGPEPHTVELFSANVTHNLTDMADEAGIYKHLWRPNKIEITTAKELIEPLTAAVVLMQADPARFEKLNPPNGWGSYKTFVPWIEKYIEACRTHPKATVTTCR